MDSWIETENPNATGSILMYRDSFGESLLPFVAGEFEKGYFSRLVPYNLLQVEQYQPDVVVIEKVERNLDDFITDMPIVECPEVENMIAPQALSLIHIYTTDYYSFYSPVGSDTICELRVDDDVWKLECYLDDKEASAKKAAVRLKYTGEDVKGESCVFDLYSNTVSLIEYLEYELNPPEETDFGKNLLVMEYSIQRAVLTRKDGIWIDAGGQLFLGDDAKEIFGTLEEAFEHEFSVEDFFNGKRPWQEYPEEFVTYLSLIHI